MGGYQWEAGQLAFGARSLRAGFSIQPSPALTSAALARFAVAHWMPTLPLMLDNALWRFSAVLSVHSAGTCMKRMNREKPQVEAREAAQAVRLT
jgi:hypothetical protein